MFWILKLTNDQTPMVKIKRDVMEHFSEENSGDSNLNAIFPPFVFFVLVDLLVIESFHVSRIGIIYLLALRRTHFKICCI